MRREIQKIIIFGSLLLVFLQQSSALVFAQESTPSATISTPTPTPHYSIATSSASLTTTPAPEDNPFVEPVTPTVVSSSQDLLGQSLVSLQTQSSASVRQLPVVGKLGKHSYKHDEKVSVTVGNQQAGDITVTLLDAYKKQIDPAVIEETTIGTQTLVSIDPSQFNFKPGKYTLKITDNTGNTTTQDFTWGVLALNTNKSYYLPNENADISIGVLDDNGSMVCNAAVTLTITLPDGSKQILSTKDKSIVVNSQCYSHDMSLVPDYEAHFAPSVVGNYDMSLSATTNNGTNTIDETMRVVDSVPFDVERVSATRLYPVNTYPMIFHITANQDFAGTVVETVPANFNISPYASQSAQTFTDTSLVMPIPNAQQQFGVPSLTLGMPFGGTYKMVQGFGVALTDPLEKAYYEQFGLAGHDGLDFAVPTGTKILATDDGIVSLSGEGAYGTTIVITHSWGRSYYGHLSKVEVAVGDHVTRGQEIGLSGNTGHVTGPHLHFGIKPLRPDMRNGFYGKVDPTQYLASLAANSQVLGVSTSTVTSSQKIITWNVTLKKGDSIDLAYNYQSPQTSPAFFDLGPLKFIAQGNDTIFTESRQWELAIDTNSSAGPNNCGTGADDGTTSGAGTTTWSFPTRACSSTRNTTNSVTGLGGVSHYLDITNFAFSSTTIPATSKIFGIQFAVSRLGTSIVDNAIYPIKGGTVQIGATNHADLNVWSTVTSLTYGSTSDLWGVTWLASDITATGFGISIEALNNGGTVQTATINAFVTATVTFNKAPTAPTQSTPTNAATGISTTPTFTMTTTDPESDNLQYKVTIYNATGCSTGVVQTNDESSTQTGWSGQNATVSTANDSYTSGSTATFTAQTALSGNTQYWWRATAKDPLGSNAPVDSTTCNSFTTTASSGPTLDQLLKHGAWFNAGVRQPFTF